MESTLSLQLSDFAAEVGSYLGFGRTTTNWTGWSSSTPYIPSAADTQLDWIMACVQAGLRQFYFPKMTEMGGVAHKWSFLSPLRQLTLTEDVNVYDLPDDVYSISGNFTFQPSDFTRLEIDNVGIGQVRQLLIAEDGRSGKPRICSIQPKPFDGVVGQRYSITFAPVPDDTYTLDYKCDVYPNALSSVRPVPYGGMIHGETILYSMLAVAEERFHGDETVKRPMYQERLQASISADIRDFQPDRLGYVGDKSDYPGRQAVWREGIPDTTGLVLFEGGINI